MRLRITGEIYGRKFDEVLSGRSELGKPALWQRIYEKVWPLEADRERFKRPLQIELLSMRYEETEKTDT